MDKTDKRGADRYCTSRQPQAPIMKIGMNRNSIPEPYGRGSQVQFRFRCSRSRRLSICAGVLDTMEDTCDAPNSISRHDAKRR